MTEMIFNQAQCCRKRYKTSDPYELLDAMDVVLLHSNAYPRDGLRGYCTVMNRTKYVVINQKQPEEEQRVVAGHEGAHLILHMAHLKVGAMRDFDLYNTTSRLERQANFFAADLMIADDDVLDLMHSRDADFFDVAKQLLVPAPFLSFKLYSMVNRGFRMHVPLDLDSTFLKRGV